jgi:hypothetical protein
MSMLFAATYPDRTIALCTFGCTAKRLRSPDYPWAPSWEERAHAFDDVERYWTTGLGWDDIAPSLDTAGLAEISRYYRRCASPGAGAGPDEDEHVRRRARRPPYDRRADGRDASDRGSRCGRRGGPLHRCAHPGRALRRVPGRRPLLVDAGPGRDPGRDRGARDRGPARAAAQPCARNGALHRHRRIDPAHRRDGRPPLVGAACAPPRGGAPRARALGLASALDSALLSDIP